MLIKLYHKSAEKTTSLPKMMCHGPSRTPVLQFCKHPYEKEPKDLDFLAHPFKIDPYNKFFRNRSVVFGQWIDLPLGDDGSCTPPLSSGVQRHACKRSYVFLLRTAFETIAVTTPEAMMTTISTGASTIPGIPAKKSPSPKR